MQQQRGGQGHGEGERGGRRGEGCCEEAARKVEMESANKATNEDAKGAGEREGETRGREARRCEEPTPNCDGKLISTVG